MGSKASGLAVAAVAVAGLASAAFGQERVLKNDRWPVDVSQVADANMSIQAGFVAGEIAAAVLPIPSNVRRPVQVKRVQIFWASTTPQTVAPSEQGSVVVYQGSVLRPGATKLFDSAIDGNGGDGLLPQLQDGFLNEFDFVTEQIVTTDPNVQFITVGLEFATATNQISGPSVVSDWPPNNPQRSTPGRNAIFGTWPEQGILTEQWFEPRLSLNLGGIPFVVGISGNFFIRAVIEPALPPCPADIAGEGAAPGGDNILDNNDFVYFIQLFFANDPAADIGSQGADAMPDGAWDNNDFIVFIQQFFTGC
jgi:hypothetical protein